VKRAPLFVLPLLLAGCGTMIPGGIACYELVPQVISLGAAQDAGFPHLACFRTCCETARADGRREPVAALAVIGENGWWLVDATPDLPQQVHSMGSLPQGILLTHAHAGHYTGLMYLGREGMNARGMPVHCSEKMAEFLRANAPWDQLVKLGNVELRPFRSGEILDLDPWILVEPIAVPHRNEYADTHAFGITLPGCDPLLYLPDLDRWDTGWALDPGPMLDRFPTLVLDGTFHSAADLDGRDLSEIPHPPVLVTLEFLAQRGQKHFLWFTHLNHTNPLWDPDSDASRAASQMGYGVARSGKGLSAFLP
jgi:pyrroloquinoline quinone biosynthesis protein B